MALGGDIAYQYGKNGLGSGSTDVFASQGVISESGFGSSNQTLGAFMGLKNP